MVSYQGAEDALTTQLATDIGCFEPGHAPVETVISQGRVMRTKRRAWWGSGLAAAAVVGVAAPLAVSGAGGPSPATGSYGPVSVTVDAPRIDGHGQPIFSGAVGGKTWTAKVASSGPNQGCYSDWICTRNFPAPADPAGMIFPGGPGSGAVSRVSVIFRADVTSLDVSLVDGDTFTLHPAEFHGFKLALFELPAGYLVAQVVAHTPAGDQLGIPFHTPDGGNLLRQWYPAGTTPAPAVHQAVIATGRGPRDNGSKYGDVGPDENWTATAETGPFGTCIVEHWGKIFTSSCTPLQTKALTRLPYLPTADPTMAQPFATEVDPTVDHVEVVFDNGSRTTLRPVLAGGHAFVGLMVPIGRQVVDAPSYDRAGHVLGDPAGQPNLMSKDNWYTAVAPSQGSTSSKTK
jgi:hypothetical protein